ncbi:hypothetical protein D3C80_1175740 [compost metagenome]
MVDALLAQCLDGGIEVVDLAIEAHLHLFDLKRDRLRLAAELVLQAGGDDDAFCADLALEKVTEGFQA